MYLNAVKTLALVLLSCTLHAQVELEAYAEAFTKLLLQSDVPADSLGFENYYITVAEYHQLLDRQLMNSSAKSEAKARFLRDYESSRQRFLEACARVHNDLGLEAADGAEMAFGAVRFSEEASIKGVVALRIRVNYRLEGDQNPIYIECNAAEAPGGTYKIMDTLILLFE